MIQTKSESAPSQQSPEDEVVGFRTAIYFILFYWGGGLLQSLILTKQN